MSQPPSSFCPVPENQQPLQEYEELKEAWLFAWTVQPVTVYVRKLCSVAVLAGLLCAPLAAASFPVDRAPLRFVLATGMGSLFLLFLLIAHLYLGWRYIGDRLTQETVIYEESGWYDGQKWQKPQEILMRDRLVMTYQVNPILSRLHKTFLTLGIFASFDVLTWVIV